MPLVPSKMILNSLSAAAAADHGEYPGDQAALHHRSHRSSSLLDSIGNRRFSSSTIDPHEAPAASGRRTSSRYLTMRSIENQPTGQLTRRRHGHSRRRARSEPSELPWIDYYSRREKLRADARGPTSIDALLVSAPTNVSYLTGFSGDSSVLIRRSRAGPDRLRRSFHDAARAGMPGAGGVTFGCRDRR